MSYVTYAVCMKLSSRGKEKPSLIGKARRIHFAAIPSTRMKAGVGV